ncbi:MAG: carboxylesterase family protein [Bryobacterales bacterium]|nr:carboxylesterase family protein [Bryobacterales bacterium]
MPFAAPPIGDLRWQPPRPPQPWSTTRLTTQLPAPCPQQTEGDDFLGTEDCLYLNVWTPANARNRPVLFFLHGGANVQGSTSVQAAGKYLYDGSGLAGEHNVVVVTVQYRLGALGFLAHPALAPGR